MQGASAAALARPNAWRASLAASAATAPRLIFPGRLCNGGVTASDNGKLQVVWPERNGAVETVESTERAAPITKTSANIVPCDFLGAPWQFAESHRTLYSVSGRVAVFMRRLARFVRSFTAARCRRQLLE